MTADSALDRFAEALNAPASSAEIAAEAEVVTQMHGLLSPATGATVILKAIFGHKVAAAATAIALGSTGVAAASGNVPFLVQEEVPAQTEEVVEEVEDDPVVEEIDEIEVVEPEVLEVQEVPVIVEDDEVLPPTNDEGEPYGDVACDDAENHGEYVSSVARDRTIEGPRGQVISQAAQTDCGKTDDEDDLDEQEESDDTDELELLDDDDDDDDEDDNRRGRGNSNGKGPKNDK